MNGQRGAVPIAAIIAIIVALLAGGYFMASRSGNVPALPGGIGAPALNPNCKFNDPDLCKFVNNWKEITNYTAKSVSTSKEGKFEALTEFSGTDRFHMTTSQNGKENYNLITIGDTTYTKDYSDNKWWKQKQTKQAQDIKTESEFKVDTTQAEDKTTYKLIGKEACSSLQCFKYQVLDPAFKDMTEFIWFDDREYLLRKTRTESAGSVDETEYSYDKVTINEPSPTKDAQPGESVAPAGNVPGFSQEELKKIQEESQKTVESQPAVDQAQPVIDTTQDNPPTDGFSP